MKKIILLAITLAIFVNCSNSDEGIDCTLFDPVFPSLYIRILDSTGVNLIENGTINPNNITVEGDFSAAGFQVVAENEFPLSDPVLSELNNSLRLIIARKSAFQYTINFADIDKAITIDFAAEETKILCDVTYFKPIKGDYENLTMELREVRNLQFVGDLNLKLNKKNYRGAYLPPTGDDQRVLRSVSKVK